MRDKGMNRRPSQNDPPHGSERRDDRRRRRVSSRGRARRHADRNSLWPRGGCDLGCGGRGDIRRKATTAISPLIAHVLDVETARQHAVFGDEAEQLALAFWPGPLTLVLPAAATSRVSLLARAGLDTVALRAPSHETARALIEAAGVPLAAPSANRSGRVSPTTAAHVLADLDGKIDWILDAGPSRHGLELTIVACLADRPQLLRPGAITREAVELVLGSRMTWSRVPNGAESARAIGVALCSQRCSSTGSRRRCGR